MLLAVYQQEDNVIVNWGTTAPYNYDRFQVTWKKDDQYVDYRDVDSYVDRTTGFWRLPISGPGKYTVQVEGCDSHGLQGSMCLQQWTIPASVDYSQPAHAVTISNGALDLCRAPFTSSGLIYDRWMELGGPEGPLGCPTGPEQPVSADGRDGRSVTFDHGQIVWLPDQGAAMLLAVYQQGGRVIVNWGTTTPYHYELFLVRWDKNGQQGGQAEVSPFGVYESPALLSGERGFLGLPIDTNVSPDKASDQYTVQVEGCDGECIQGWTIPASVNSSPYEIDFSGVPAATTPDEADQYFDQRAKIVSRYNACRGHVLQSAYKDEEDFMVVAIAKLYLAHIHDNPVGCPTSAATAVDFHTEVNDALRSQTIESASGSSGCNQTGEYDVALKGYITMMYRFAADLDPDVRYRILHHLLNKTGGYDPGDENKSCGLDDVVPETENHLLMIETSRYLTNQSSAKRGRMRKSRGYSITKRMV